MYIEVGKVVGVWGVKGWVKLHSYTREREGIAEYSVWYLSKPRRGKAPRLDEEAVVSQYEVKNCRAQGANIVAQLNGLDDRDEAANLNGYHILVKQSDLPELCEQEYYWHQLVGLEVSNQQAGQTEEIGRVSSIMETGANDVLVITQTGPESSREILVPYIDSVVTKIDLAEKRMIVNWDLSYLDD